MEIGSKQPSQLPVTAATLSESPRRRFELRLDRRPIHRTHRERRFYCLFPPGVQAHPAFFASTGVRVWFNCGMSIVP
jgi:hypothetical protein